MATAEVFSGVCGFTTRIHAKAGEKRAVELSIETECPNVAKMIGKLEKVDPFKELFNKLHETETYKVTSGALPHPGCPVPSGIFKAIEVAAGMALPRDAHIRLTDQDPNG